MFTELCEVYDILMFKFFPSILPEIPCQKGTYMCLMKYKTG